MSKLASKTRKSRRTGWCPLCRRVIITGQRVGWLPRKGWAHWSCGIAVNQAREGTTP